MLTGLPTGLVWFLLRVEARRGGRGDRTIDSRTLIEVLRTVAALGALGVVAAVLTFEPVDGAWHEQLRSWRLLPNALLVVLYLAIGAILLRTQIQRYNVSGVWSLSGLGITGVFPTCAAMHAVWLGYVVAGRYEPEFHLLVIDTIAVPAALYFIVVSWLLGEGRLTGSGGAWSDVSRPEGHDEAEADQLLRLP